MGQLANTNTTPSVAEIGYGSTFATGTGSGGSITYTIVAEVTSIKPSGVTTGEEDVTSLQSPGGVREYIPTLSDNGTFELTANYIGDATQLNVESLALARTIFPFQIQGAVGGKTQTRTGRGFFTKFNQGDLTVDKVASFTATFRVTGVVTTTTV
jgi:hypothetical protein